jgi:gluconolactonase
MSPAAALALTLAFVGLDGPGATYEPGAGASSVVPRGAKVRKLWGEGTFTEGGALAGDGSILFSDIGDRAMRFDPSTGKVTAFRDPSGRSNGMVFDPRGRLVVAEGANTGGNRRVSIAEADGTVRTLADRYDGKKFNSPNDLTVDASGRVYMSDPRYVGDEPRELDFEGVFRIDTDGSVHRLETTATKPNGLAISPDGKTLYVADNGSKRRALVALSLDGDGNVTKPRVIKDFGKGGGIDGMTVTTDGRIVATVGDGTQAGVSIFSPEGETLAFIATPEDPANVEFGGPDRRTLYICAGKSLYSVETTMEGFHLWPPAGK